MWSESKQAGLVLAAVLCDDRALAGVGGQLDPSVRSAARDALSALQQADPGAKAASLRRWSELVRPKLASTPADFPARGLGLLARHVPRELGRAWLRGAAGARPDFAPDADLVSTLLRLATRREGGLDP